VLLAHLLRTIAKLLGPAGAKAVVAEILLVKQQLLVINRSRRRPPNLSALDRLLFGLWALFLSPRGIRRTAVVIRPSTLLKFHDLLKKRKYRLLYSSGSKGKPGPKGPSPELIQAIVKLKRRNPRFGCRRIAQQIANKFGIDIDKDLVRRVLVKRYRPGCDNGGPSGLTFLGHTEDSLWSIDLFRCESILLDSHWVLVIMDQFTRRIIGFGVHAGDIDGVALCRMFNKAISKTPPKYLSSDNGPLFQYHRWKTNLRVLKVDKIKSVPYVPLSHLFVERLIGTIRREYLDRVFFWNAQDLERELVDFRQYYNRHRVHQLLNADTTSEISGEAIIRRADLNQLCWKSHCRGLYQLPVAA